jgi:predicted AAA+ superfamily ATPase
LFLPRVAESLAGRMEAIHLQPLTESEKERNPGSFLQAFLSGHFKPQIMGDVSPSEPSLPERLVAGGYPEPLTRSASRARQWHRQYLKAIIERDVQDVARIRDSQQVARLIELLAQRTAGLLNTSALAQELGMYRDTIEHYLTVLERLFLVHRLPAWHRNAARRLIKAPKVHIVDCGLAATLANLEAHDWLTKREQMGHLLVSFVVQQIVTQAAWGSPELRFWHYRDKDQVEVDLVVTRGDKTWGIEVKAASSIREHDSHGLARLANQSGKDFQTGIVLYGGANVLPLRGGPFLAVPIRKLWEM